MAEGVVIEVTDGVSTAPAAKIRDIGAAARESSRYIELLNQQLAAIDAGNPITRLQQQLAATTTAAQTLQTQLNLTVTAHQNLINAQTANAISSQRLQTEIARTATAAQQLITAQTQGATAAQRLTTAQQQTATAAVNTTIAQQNLATAQQRTVAATTQAATATQQLATAQQQTIAATNQAANAQNQAALSALRLQQAQNQAAQAHNNAGSALLRYVAAAAAAVGIGLGAGEIIHLADAYTTLQNKLQTVSTSQAQVNNLTERLIDVANRSYASVDATATIFTRLDRALQRTGRSQEETLSITETLNKALVVFGANTQEAHSVLLQLSQAFNAGKLQGNDFRSVAEFLPALLTKIAEVMKKPVEQVKELGSKGKINIDIIAKAINLLGVQVDQVFPNMQPTVGQAMTVMHNSMEKFIGDTNKATGITNGLANAIIFLSQHLGAVTIVIAALASGLTVALLPVLLRVTEGMRAFLLLSLANPWVLLATAIVGAGLAIAEFGDNVHVASNGGATLKDLFRTAFDYIKEGAGATANFFQDRWGELIGFLEGIFGRIDVKWSTVSGAIGEITKLTVNAIANAFAAGWNFITTIFQNLPGVFDIVFTSILNLGISAVEALVNAWQYGGRAIAGVMSNIAPDTAKSLNDFLDKTEIKIPRAKLSDAGKKAADDISAAFGKEFNKDYAGNFMAHANGLASDRFRQGEIESRNGQLRGRGTDVTTPTPEKVKKTPKSRADFLNDVNKKLDDEISRMQMLKPLREDQLRFDQIDEELQKKRIKLTPEETATIKDKIAQIRIFKDTQKEMDRIYDEVTGPLRTYNGTVAATKILLAAGTITQAQANKEINKAAEAYLNALDPLREFNIELGKQYDQARMRPLEKATDDILRGATTKKGAPLDANEVAFYTQMAKAIDTRNKAQTAENQILDASVGTREEFARQLKAIHDLTVSGQEGFNAGDAAQQTSGILKNMGIDPSALQVGMDAQLAIYQDYYTKIGQMLDAGVLKEKDAAAASRQVRLMEQSFVLSKSVEFFDGLAEMAHSQNKKIAEIGKAASIASTMIKTYENATKAYGAMIDIPYIGPALAVAAAAAAVAAGMANVAAIKAQPTGFMGGGFTGNVGIGAVAGVVHGQEFVSDAATTRKHRPLLEALNSGAEATSINDGSRGGGDTYISMEFNNEITVEGSGEQSSADALLGAGDALSRKVQADILENRRSGGVWAKVLN